MNEYTFISLLGKGGFAEVKKVSRTINVNGKEDSKFYALKIINKKMLKKKYL